MHKISTSFSTATLRQSLEAAENEVRSWPDGMRRQTISTNREISTRVAAHENSPRATAKSKKGK